MPGRGRLAGIVADLEAFYGRPATPPKDPLHLILWENVGYLVDDAQRAVAFAALEKRVGLTPERILAARPSALEDVARLGGILPEQRVGKLLAVAQIARRHFHGDLAEVVRRPIPEARKALKRFPGIGDPGAEKILLFTGNRALPALESNGLRVLLRLGYGDEKKGYAATYRAVQTAVAPELRPTCHWLIRWHLVLRRHGQQLCRRSRPQCPDCPVSDRCAYARGAAADQASSRRMRKP
jgi:endonuclease III